MTNMNEELRDLLAQRREAVNRFCQMAAQQSLAEEWLEDAGNLERYSAW